MRWLSVAVPIVCFIAFTMWLVLQLSKGDLDRSDKLASIISMSVTIITLPLGVLAIVVTVRQSRPARAVLTLAERLDEMAEALVIAVRSQWEAEEQIRRIHDPFPLPARWTNAPEHLTDHWQMIHGESHPLVLDGHGDHIVDTFDRIPSGRLVVLGRAGAGKTILTSRFVLTLLASRPQPVPVIFSLGSWDPTASSLRDWLTDQLITTYPVLAEQDDTGITVAEQLLTTSRIMPVFDGFDEISEGLRAVAINAINAGLRLGDRLLLTSRFEEYAAAVQAGDVLTGAAVVRLENLNVADLARYLPLTTRKAHNGRSKWEPILDHLHAGPSPLSEVLSTPLMVALARAIFSDTAADPAELLTVTSATKLEERLLAGFLLAVYSDSRNSQSGRWLGFLAGHLRRLDTYDLAWWKLVLAVPRTVIGLLAGIMLTVATWLVTGLPVWLGVVPGEARAAWVVTCLSAGPLAGAICGFLIARLRGLRPMPGRGRTHLRIRGRLGVVFQELMHVMFRWPNLLWFALWAFGGLLFGWAGQVISGSVTGILLGLAAGTVLGVGTWFVPVFVRRFGTWADPREAVNPKALLRIDRTTALREGLTVGVGVSIVLWVVIWLVFERVSSLSFGIIYGQGLWVLNWFITVATVSLTWMLFAAVWGPWLIARFWLQLTRRLPWSVMEFLDDAHRRGVLRQAGGVYQFRHAHLQDHLAQPDEYRPRHASPR